MREARVVAMGLERVLLALPEEAAPLPPLVFLAPMGAEPTTRCLVLAEALRRAGHKVELDGRAGSLKSMLRRANTMGARLCLVLGDTELAEGRIQCKDLARREQTDLLLSEVPTRLPELLALPPISPGPSEDPAE